MAATLPRRDLTAAGGANQNKLRTTSLTMSNSRARICLGTGATTPMRGQRETWKILLWLATGLSMALAVYLGMLVLALEKSSALSPPDQRTYVAVCAVLACGCLLGPALAWRSFGQGRLRRSVVFACLPIVLLACVAMAHGLGFHR